MKDKVLVRVIVPMGDLAMDFRIPYDLDAAVVTDMLVQMLQRLRENEEKPPIGQPAVLWWKRKGKLLDGGATLREYGVTDSEQLLLI